MKFSELCGTYGGMRTPSFSLTVAGNVLPTGPGARLLRAESVTTSRMEAGMLAVHARIDPEGEEGGSWLTALQVGAAGSLSLGWDGTNQEVFSGLLYEVTWSDPLEGGGMEVEAVFLDAKGKLALTSLPHMGGKTLAQLVQAALDTSGAETSVETIPEDWDLPVQMWGKNCRTILQNAAEFLAWEFYDWCGTVYFGPPRPESKVILEYDGPKGLTELRRWRTLAGQWSGVAVAGADDGGERLGSQTDRASDSGFGTDKIAGVLGVLHWPEPAVRTMAQAQALSQARMEAVKRSGGGIRGRGVGVPELRPGRFVQFSGLSDPVSGTYYIHTVRHMLDEDGFETVFEGEE